MHNGTPCIDNIWLMLTNELWTASFQNPWGPNEFVSYSLLYHWPTYVMHKHKNTSEGATFLYRDVAAGTDTHIGVEVYGGGADDW